MTVHEQFYLTCTGCGKVHSHDDGSPMCAETPEEVRDDAEDNGWHCYVGDVKSEEQRDYCPDCMADGSGIG